MSAARRRTAPARQSPGESPSERPGLHPPRRAGRSTRLIGQVVVDLGLADADTVDDAVKAARDQGRPTGQVLVERGVLTPDQRARALAQRLGLGYLDLSVF